MKGIASRFLAVYFLEHGSWQLVVDVFATMDD